MSRGDKWIEDMGEVRSVEVTIVAPEPSNHQGTPYLVPPHPTLVDIRYIMRRCVGRAIGVGTVIWSRDDSSRNCITQTATDDRGSSFMHFCSIANHLANE